MANNLWSSRVYIGTTFVRRTHAEWETTWLARKTTSDIVYCTSMIKALQQPLLAVAFVKCMARMPCTIAPATVGLENSGTEPGAVKMPF